MMPKIKVLISLMLCLMLLAMFSACKPAETGAEGMITVNFFMNDGTEDLFTSISGKAGESIFTPSGNPQRSGFLFAGWYMDPAGTEAFSNAPTEDTSVYAKWGQPVKVSFISEGVEIPDVEVPAGSLIEAPPQPMRDGYIFDAWYTDDMFTAAWDFFGSQVNADTVLYGKWISMGYSVTLDLGNGDLMTLTEPGPFMERPGDPLREGFMVEGWYKDPAFAEPFDFASEMIAADVTIYAKWVEIPSDTETFTVTFDSKGGSSVKALSGVVQGTTIAQPSSPTRSGYRFGGWYKDSALKTAWSFSKDKVEANITLYAKWTATESSSSTQKYSVTFNSNGGTAVSTIKNVSENSTISQPANPTRSGYVFAGWYSDSGLTRAWSFGSDVVTGSFTLYAKWTTAGITVTFNSNGGSAVTSLSNVVANALITQPANPTRAGYGFAGWYKDSGLLNAWNFSTDRVTDSITLYAKWVIGFTVTYNSNGGSSVAALTGVPSGVTINAPTSPTWTGYSFVGWYKDTALLNAWNFSSDRVTADVTLYAKWAAGFTVTFNSNGGSSVASISPVASGATIGQPANPTKSGFTFVRWYKESTLTTPWNFATDKVTSSITLYAMWAEAASVTVNFNVNGGTGSFNPITATVDSTITLPATAPTRADHNFLGWYTAASGGSYAGGVGGSYKVTAQVTTLYAKWEAITPDPTTSPEG